MRHTRNRIDGAVEVLRSWFNDGADGESAHVLCDTVEDLRAEVKALSGPAAEAKHLRDMLQVLLDHSSHAGGAAAIDLHVMIKAVLEERPEGDPQWEPYTRRCLHALHHIRAMECETDHDMTEERCPVRTAKEAIDNRPCSLCGKDGYDDE